MVQIGNFVHIRLKSQNEWKEADNLEITTC